MVKETILVVDDQDASRAATADLLRACGYPFFLAADVAQAVREAVDHSPQLIMLNVSSPLLGQLDVLSALLDQVQAVPVVLSLAAGAAQLDVRLFRARVRSVLLLPATADEVQAAFERALEPEHLRRETMQLQARLQEHLEQYWRLYAIGQAIASQSEYQEVFNRLVEAAVYVTGAEEAYLLVQDVDSSRLRVRAQVRPGVHDAETTNYVLEDPLARGFPQALSVPAAEADASAPAVLDVPLKVRGRPAGLLRVLRHDQGGPFTALAYQKVSVLNSYAALAIEKIDFAAGIPDAVERALLSQISAFFGTTLRLDNVLEMVVDVAIHLVDAACGYIVLYDERTGQYVPRVSFAFELDELDSPRFVPAREIVSQVIRECEAVLVGPGYSPFEHAAGDLSLSALCVPMERGHKVTGAIYVEQPNHRPRFSEHDLAMLSSLSLNAGAAIENARLFDEVEAERRKLDAILRETHQPVIVTDQEGVVLLMNQAASRILGSRVRGTGFFLWQAINHRGLSNLFEQARISGRLQQGEIEVSEGQVYSATVTPITHVGLITVMQDITDIKKLSQLKTEFVATVSHDLRSPLSVVQGFLSILDQAGPLTEQQAAFIADAQREVTRLFELTGILLDLGRLDSGIELDLERCDLKTLVGQAAADWQERAAEHQHKLSVELPSEQAYVLGNPTLLRQVVDNLLSNAIKYTPPGGQIQIQLALVGAEMVLQVTDSGIGIALEDQPYVFDRFYRVHNDYTRDIDGTGLGLAIVRSIAERHGGRVWLQSKEGEGTTIGIALPAL